MSCWTRRKRPSGRPGPLRSLGSSLHLDLATPERVLAAARIKADHPMAFADAFAVATAKAFDATLLTGDPEIIATPLDIEVWDLR